MAEAHYRIAIPAQDALGQALHPDLPVAVHQWLYQQHPRLFRGGWVDGPHRGLWEGAEAPEHHYHVVTHDLPEADSYVKQAAAHVGDAANRPYVAVTKTGDGTQSWLVPNPSFRGGEGAHPSVLAPLSPSGV